MSADWFMFDPDITRAETERYRVRIRTGMSIFARNRITALGRQFPAERAALWQLLMHQAGELREGLVSSATLRPGVMETQPFAYWVEAQQRTILLAITWGFVVRGRPRYDRMNGDFVLAIVEASEVEQAARELFHAKETIEA